MTPSERSRLGEVALVFLRLGATAFGGPAAHVAIMEAELVTRRGWISREEFLDLYAAAQLVPGPNSTELAIHVGLRRAGPLGLVVAGVAFIVPAALMVVAIAWAYVRFGALPALARPLEGMKPAVVAIVVNALLKLAPSAIRQLDTAVVAVFATIAAGLGADELAVLACAGLVIASTRARPSALLAVALPAAPSVMPIVPATSIFLVFAKIGSVLFGSGYVLLAFLRSELVSRGWLSEAQILDATAVGQITPGPLFTTATFVGYLLGGFSGAGAATLGIFLPAFVFVAVSGVLLPRLLRTKTFRAFLDGVNAGSLALMAVVTWQLGRAALVDAVSIAIFAASFLALVRWKVNATWLLAAGALIRLLAP